MFLVAVIATAEKGKTTFQQILALRNESEAKLLAMGRRGESGKKLLELLYRRPSVSSADVAKHLRVSNVAAYRIIRAFLEAGILVEITGFKRNQFFQFRKYLALFRK